MFTSFIFLFSCLAGLAGGVVCLSFFIAKHQRKLAEKIRQDTFNDLTARGKLTRQGEVGLVIQHVYNPEIVDAFIEKFNEAYTETAYCMEFHSGEVRLWFKITDVKMTEKIEDELEKSGFYVGNGREG